MINQTRAEKFAQRLYPEAVWHRGAVTEKLYGIQLEVPGARTYTFWGNDETEAWHAAATALENSLIGQVLLSVHDNFPLSMAVVPLPFKGGALTIEIKTIEDAETLAALLNPVTTQRKK